MDSKQRKKQKKITNVHQIINTDMKPIFLKTRMKIKINKNIKKKNYQNKKRIKANLIQMEKPN